MIITDKREIYKKITQGCTITYYFNLIREERNLKSGIVTSIIPCSCNKCNGICTIKIGIDNEHPKCYMCGINTYIKSIELYEFITKEEFSV